MYIQLLVVCFYRLQNKFKEENPKAPDYRVYKQKDLDSSAPKKESEEEDVDLI